MLRINKDTTGNVSGGNADDYGMEMPKRGDLDSFFNAKKKHNNRADIYGNDPYILNTINLKETNRLIIELKMELKEDELKDGVKDSVNDDVLKNNVQKMILIQTIIKKYGKIRKTQKFKYRHKDKNLNLNSSDLDNVPNIIMNSVNKFQISKLQMIQIKLIQIKLIQIKVDTNKVISKEY